MDLDRVVEVYCPVSGHFGTGYLASGDTVLTAWHVVNAEKTVTVRPFAAGPAFYAARTVWPLVGRTVPFDAALLVIDDPTWHTPDIPAVRWGVVAGAARVAVIGIGFPDAAQDPDPVRIRRDTLPIRGHIDPLAHAKSADKYFLVGLGGSLIPAREPGAGGSPWSGASGAALFHQTSDVLLGLVQVDHTLAIDARVLAAVPVSALASDATFNAVATRHGLDLSLESVTGDDHETGIPRGLHNLPELPSTILLGRGEVLDALVRGLARRMPGITYAISGLGGIGKTTLALRYAHDHCREHTLTWWIDASDSASVERGLAELAERLDPETHRHWTTQRGAALRAIDWLQNHAGWLVVLDNADRPETVDPLLGAVRSVGSIIITSRYVEFPNALHISLPVLSRSDSIALLGRLSGQPATDNQAEAAGAIAHELGDLPLALEHAAAYLRKTRASYGDYLQLLLDTPNDLLGTAVGGDPGTAIAQTWKITISLIVARNPLAVEILRVSAWYAPDGIPRDLLAPLADRQIAVPLALAELAGYSMITLADREFSVHRLVQAVLRHGSIGPDEMTASGSRDTARQLLVRSLAPRVDLGPRDQWSLWRALVPHVRSVQAASQDTDGFDGSLADALTHAARQLIEHGQLDTGIAFHEVALADRERVLGQDHPDTLASRNNLAHACRMTGNLERAIALHEVALADYERVRGVDHPETLTARSNLASAYREAGRLNLAIPLFTRTLAERERLLGRDHEDTLASRNSLAYAYRVASDFERAVPLHEVALADYERVLGPRHPATLTARSNLAIAYRAAGDLERAIPLLESVLVDYERVLGPDHPDTFYARNNLGYAYRVAGNHEQAIVIHEALLAESERFLGPGHPDTLIYRNALAHAHRVAGNLETAIALFEENLADRERVLGREHPDTLATRGNLGYVLLKSGAVDRAVISLRSTQLDCERVLGPDHPTTRITRDYTATAVKRLRSRR